MKKFVLLLCCLIFLSASSYATQDYKDTVLFVKNQIKKHNEFQKDYEIYTRAHDWTYDSKRKHYIIHEDIKNFSVNVVFEKEGRVIKFADKFIKYKNGRFSQIGNDYVSYLNGKLHTIGKNKVELDSRELYVEKIGEKTPQEYLIGDKFTKKDVLDSNQGHPGMIFTIAADGSDFGGIFTDVIIPFEGTPVSDGSKDEPKIRSIGGERVEYTHDGRIESIGGKRVEYW